MIELEDLLTKCTDKNSKIYIEEAIKSYKNGAYRACINSTWLAVFTNIIYSMIISANTHVDYNDFGDDCQDCLRVIIRRKK